MTGRALRCAWSRRTWNLDNDPESAPCGLAGSEDTPQLGIWADICACATDGALPPEATGTRAVSQKGWLLAQVAAAWNVSPLSGVVVKRLVDTDPSELGHGCRSGRGQLLETAIQTVWQIHGVCPMRVIVLIQRKRNVVVEETILLQFEYQGLQAAGIVAPSSTSSTSLAASGS